MPLPFPILLAQAAPEPQALSDFLAVFFYLAGSVVALVVGWFQIFPRKQAETPQPFTVRQAEEFATKAQLTEVHGRIKRERGEIDAHFARVEQAALEATRRVDHELHAIRESIEDGQRAGEARVETLREKIDDQTKLIISVIREGGGHS